MAKASAFLVPRSGFHVLPSIVLCALLVTAVRGHSSQEDVRIALSEDTMGTTFSVELYGGDRATLDAAAGRALAEAVRLDRLLSNYRPESEWSAMNRGAARGPFVVSAELFELVAACLTYSRATEGAFDVTVGPLMKVWGFFRDEGTLPPADAVERALTNVGSGHVRLDRARSTVEFLRAGVELDPGGIGKGYAIDRMVAVLKDHGVTRAFLSAGGSSIYGLGAPPDNDTGWRVVIRHPRAAEGVAAELFLKDVSLSTSGSYEKFFRANGRTYSHIIDPRTGFPARGITSASVVAPRAIDGEAWTKASFIKGRAWTARRRPPGTRVLICDEGETAACTWIE